MCRAGVVAGKLVGAFEKTSGRVRPDRRNADGRRSGRAGRRRWVSFRHIGQGIDVGRFRHRVLAIELVDLEVRRGPFRIEFQARSMALNARSYRPVAAMHEAWPEPRFGHLRGAARCLAVTFVRLGVFLLGAQGVAIADELRGQGNRLGVGRPIRFFRLRRLDVLGIPPRTGVGVQIAVRIGRPLG